MDKEICRALRAPGIWLSLLGLPGSGTCLVLARRGRLFRRLDDFANRRRGDRNAPRRPTLIDRKMAASASLTSEGSKMKPEPAETLGDRIATLRRRMGWNQSELAARVGCKANQISKYERGTYAPNLLVLSALAENLGTSIDHLVTGREPMTAEPDQLIALWPVLRQLPLALRNQIAMFLNTVVHAQSVLGLSEVAWRRIESKSDNKSAHGRKRALKRRRS